MAFNMLMSPVGLQVDTKYVELMGEREAPFD
jgi:hypothetical protein